MKLPPLKTYKPFWPLVPIAATQIAITLLVKPNPALWLAFFALDVVLGVHNWFAHKRHAAWMRELAELREGLRRRRDALSGGEGVR
jgi:hypothetical protein